MGAAAWFIFMIFVLIGAKAYAEGANGIASEMSPYDEANFKYKRINKALVVAAAIGLMTIPIFVHFFD